MARLGRPKTELMLRDDEGVQLLRWSMLEKSAQALALRSGIVLGCGDGLDNTAVAGNVGCSCSTNTFSGVRASLSPGWMGWWTSRGRGGQQRSRPIGLRRSLWQRRSQRRSQRRRMRPLVPGQDGRQLRVVEVHDRPDLEGVRVETTREDAFKFSNDPRFVEKVYDVVGLYLNPPDAAVVTAWT